MGKMEANLNPNSLGWGRSGIASIGVEVCNVIDYIKQVEGKIKNFKGSKNKKAGKQRHS